MELRLLTIAVCLFGFVSSAPRLLENQCSQRCSESYDSFRYEVGKTYHYKYESWTKLHLNDQQGPNVRLSAVAKISVLRPCELALKLSDVSVDGPVDTFEYKRVLEKEPILFSFDEGRIESVCSSSDDQPWAVNLKKGLISSLQVSLKSLEGSKIVKERDVLGDCETTYEVVSRSSWKGLEIKKTKDMKTCGRRHNAVASMFPRAYTSPEFAIQNLPILSNDFSCQIIVDKDIVTHSTCVDKNSFLPLSWSKAGSHIETLVKLNFERIVAGKEVVVPRNFRHHNLLFAANPIRPQVSELQVMTTLREICGMVTDDIRPEVPSKFAELVHSLRHLPQASVARVWNSVSSGSVCSSHKLKDILADALIMDSSEGSIRLLADLILKKSVSPITTNYWLTMLAFANRPTQESIEAAIPLIESNNAPRQALLGVSSMIHNFCNNNEDEDCSNNNIVKRAVKAIAKHTGYKCRPSGPNAEDDVIVALKSLENIGAVSPALEEIFSCVADDSISDHIRVAAIEALDELACDAGVARKMQTIFKNMEHDAEVRIAAYKVLIQCPSPALIQDIFSSLERETCTQVGAYITSHLENVKSSSDPHKQHIRSLLRNQDISSHFPKDIRKFSRNLELSYVLEKLNLGGVLDSDVIYDHSFIPRSVKLNLTIPIFGKSLNFFEIGLRQVGMEEKIEALLGPHGLMKTQNIPQVFEELVNFFRMQSNEVQIKRSRNNIVDIFKGQKISTAGQALEASMYLKFDGKTIFYTDTNDAEIDRSSIGHLVKNYRQHVDTIRSVASADSALSFMFLDSVHEFPAANGLPLKLSLNGTMVVGYKGHENAVWPSIAMELSAKMGFDVKNAQPGLKWVNTFHSAPAMKAEIKYKDQRPVQVTFSLPKDKLELFSYHSDVKVVNSRSEERSLHPDNVHKVNSCSGSFLGVKLCGKIMSPKPFFNMSTPVLPLNGPWAVEVNVLKTDAGIRGWEYTLELPSESASELSLYRVAFNTPGSRVDREVSVELHLSTPRSGPKGARFVFKSPIKTIEASASQNFNDEEVSAKANLIIDREEQYEIQASLNKVSRGRKVEYQPLFKVVMPGMKPKTLSGSVTIDQGRKSQMAISLTNQASNEFLRGSIVKDGSIALGKSFRLSSDIRADLSFMTFRVFGAAEKSDSSFSSDISVEYQKARSQAEKVKLVTKVQNLSTRSLTKLTSFLELQMSQLPAYNFHINWNLLYKPNEHLENEGIVMWGNQFGDPNRKIKILQVSKFTGFNGEKVKTAENVISIDIRPLRIDYEIQLNGHMEKGETPKFKIETVANEKKQRKEYRSSLEYEHISRKPLKLSMAALLKYPSREIKYSDKLVEVSPNEYKGRTAFQWQVGKQANLDYIYRIKSDDRKTHHEFDVALDHPSFSSPVNHQCLLRMTRDELELRSKLSHQGRSLWDASSVISSVGDSKLYLDTNHFTGKVEANPWQVPSVASFELTGKSRPFSHTSNFQWGPNTLALNSKTIAAQKPVLTINSQLSKTQNSRILVDTQPWEARMELNHIGSPMTGSIELRSKKSSTSHKSTFLADSSKLDLKSKTLWNGQTVAKIQGTLNKRSTSSLNIETPKWTTSFETNPMSDRKTAQIEVRSKQSPYLHKTDLAMDRRSIQIVSKTTHNNNPILLVDSNLSRDKNSHLSFESNRFGGRFEVDPFSRQKTSKIELRDKLYPMEHWTEVKLHPQAWNLVSKTDRNGRQIVSVDGKLGDKLQNQFKIGSPIGDLNFEMNQRTGKLIVKHPNSGIQHSTEVSVQPKLWTLLSKTDRSGRQIVSIDGRMNDNIQHHLKIGSPLADLSFELNQRTGKLDISDKKNRVEHTTEVSLHPKTWTLISNTDHSGKPFVSVDGKLESLLQNHLKIGSPMADVNFEINRRTGKLEIRDKKNRMDHSTEVNVQPKLWTLYSKTEKNGNQVALIDARLNELKNQLKVESPLADMNLVVSPWKNAEFQISGQSPIFHRTSINSDFDKVNIVSQTKKQDKILFDLNSSLSRQSPCHVKLNVKPWSASLEVDPWSNVKTGKFEVNELTKPMYHTSRVQWQPNQMSLKSNTQLRNRQLLDLDSILSSSQQSYLNLKSDPLDASLEYDPSRTLRTGKLFLKRNQFEHSTNVQYLPQQYLAFQSGTQNRRQNLLNVDSKISPFQESHLIVKTQPIEGKLSVVQNKTPKSFRLELNGQQIPYTHVTDVKYSPKQELLIESNTQRSGQNVAKITSRISRAQNSNFMVDVEPFRATVDIDPLSYQKSLKYDIQGRKWGFSHASDLTYNPGQSILINSVAKKRQSPLFSFNSALNRGQKSHMNLDIPQFDTKFEVDPFSAVKSVKFDLRGKSFPHQHTTKVTIRSDRVTLNSDTTKQGQRIARIDSIMSRNDQSHLNLESSLLDARMKVNPFGNNKRAEVTVNGRHIPVEHSTNFNMGNGRLVLKSKTAYNGRSLLDLDTSVNQKGASYIKCNNPFFDGQVDADPQSNVYKVNYLAKHSSRDRRILCSTQIKKVPKSGLDLEVQWDADVDPQKRVKVSMDMNRAAKDLYNMKGEYGSSHLINIQTMMAKDLLRGPHEVNIGIEIPDHPVNIILHHEIQNGAMRCVARYIRDGDEKIEVQNLAKFESTRTGHSLDASLKVTSVYKYLNGMLFHVKNKYVSSRSVAGLQSSLDIQIPGQDAFSVVSDLSRKSNWQGGEISGQIKALTPIYDYKDQEISFKTQWNQEHLNVEGLLAALGKKANLHAEALLTNSGMESNFNVQSDFDVIPSVSATGKLTSLPNQKTIAVSVDVNRHRMADMQGKLNFHSLRDFDGQLTMDTQWTPKYSLNSRGLLKTNKVDYEVVLKQDQAELLSGAVKALDEKGTWTGNAAVSSHGKRLVFLDAKRSELPNGQSYIVRYVGPVQPVKITLTTSDSGHNLRRSLTVCPERKPCLEFEGSLQNNDGYQTTDRSMNLVFRRQRKEYRLDWILRTNQKMINKLMLNLAGVQVGYNVEVLNNRRESDYLGQIFFPERVMEVHGAAVDLGDKSKLTISFLADAKRAPNRKLVLEITHKDAETHNQRSIQTQVLLTHPVWRRPLTGSFSLEQSEANRNMPLSAHLILDVTNDPNQKLIMEASLRHPTSNPHNTTIQMAIRQADRQHLDFELESHIAHVDQLFTAGLQWRWLNMRSERKQGFYFVKADASNQKVELISKCPLNEMHASGKWQSTGNSFNMDGSVTLNGDSKRAVLQMTSEQKPCIAFSLMKPGNQLSEKFEVCLDTSGNHVFSIDGKSFRSGKEVKEFSIALAKQSDRVYRLHLNWRPETFGEIVYAMTMAEQASNIRMPKISADYSRIPAELEHKWNLFTAAIQEDVLAPSKKSFIQEIQLLQNELQLDDEYLEPIYHTLERIHHFWSRLILSLVPDSLAGLTEEVMQKLSQKLIEACAYESTCYSMAYKYQRYGWKGVSEELTKLWAESTDGWEVPDVVQPIRSWFKRLLNNIVDSDFMNRLSAMGMDSIKMAEEVLQSIMVRADHILRSFDEALLNNPEFRDLYKVVREIALEVKHEMMKVFKNVDWDKFSSLYADARAMLSSPEMWQSNARFLVWNLEDGEILVEFRPPVHPATLRSIWTKNLHSKTSQYTTVLDKMNAMKSTLYSEWAPPFTAHAMLVGGQHFVTFDRHFYDFAGSDCTYLLARDFKDTNFTVLVKYRGLDSQGRVQKSIVVQTNEKVVEILPQEGSVKLDGTIVELPLFLGPTTVTRRGQAIVVDDKHNVLVECQLEHDICTVSVSGWYFGKTRGLFGTYDYEAGNDMRLPNGRMAERPKDLARAWEAEKSCRTQNLAHNQPLRPNSREHRQCEELFASQRSPLRAGFSVVNPEPYLQMCQRHLSASQRFQASEKALCTVAAAYVKILRFHGLQLNMPSSCLNCNANEYGSRFQPIRSSGYKADVVFVVEEHKCNENMVKNLDTMSRIIERDLIAEGFADVKFGVIGFSGPAEEDVHGHTARSKLLFPAKDILLATENMKLTRNKAKKSPVDTFRAVQFAAEYKFREGASKSLVLLSCTPCDEQVMRLGYTDIQHLLLSEGITLHVVNDRPIEYKSSVTKSRGIIAVDSSSVYDAKALQAHKFVGQKDLRSQVLVPKDVCVALAHESGGSFFTSKFLSAGTSVQQKQWKSLFSHRLLKSAWPTSCQTCDCIMDSDLLHSRSVCRPCTPRRPFA
jgi:hypothetical protein